MQGRHIFSSRESKDLALAVEQTLRMWGDKRYDPFLVHAKAGQLTEEWFRWFVGAWNVARTIKHGRQGLVREYLDRDFRKELLEGGGAEAVDAAAAHIQQRAGVHRSERTGRARCRFHSSQK